MFSKILIANRGDIAMRVVRTCREMEIGSIALYEPGDIGALHLRLADVCAPLNSRAGFTDGAALLDLALEKGADALHPGVGFQAERADFARLCQAAGVAFIGPPPEVLEALEDRVAVLQRARQAGFPTVDFVELPDVPPEDLSLEAERAAARLGPRLVIKPRRGGRGPAARLVQNPDRLKEALLRSQAEARALFGDGRVYLEKAIAPFHLVAVQVLADERNLIHLGERQSLLQPDNRQVIDETPAPCLTDQKRQEIREAALELAALFDFRNVGSVEFLVDGQGEFYFTEIKPRLSISHPVTEAAAQVDLVREQIRLAAGEPLSVRQLEAGIPHHALMGRIHLELEANMFAQQTLELQRMRLPSGPNVRVDTHLEAGSQLTPGADALLAKVTVWGETRQLALRRLRRAVDECQITGAATNLNLLRSVLSEPAFERGEYEAGSLRFSHDCCDEHDRHLRDLAIAAAVLYARRAWNVEPCFPQRSNSRWRSGRRSRYLQFPGGSNHE
jgi:acetyl-CoA carboxylase biotin carboxylase subunit